MTTKEKLKLMDEIKAANEQHVQDFISANKGELIKTDRNGTKYWKRAIPCDRCGGHGYYAIGVHNGQPVLSPHDGGMCWKCMGHGKVIGTVKEYTPEYAAKLEAKRAAKQAKFEEERKQREAEMELERQRRKAEEEAERIRRAGHFVGEVGQKIKIDVTFVYQTHFESQFGITTVYVMKDDEGNTFIWKTGSGSLMTKDGETMQEGDKFTVQGTIKEHKTFRDVNQTILQRVKVIEKK